VHFALGALALVALEAAAARRGRPPVAPPRPSLTAAARSARDVDPREEALVREALARGLGDGDPVIRQRLVQKLTLLLEAESDPAEPDDVTLQRWLDEHPDDYRRIATVSFEHIFFDRARRGERGDLDARSALASLRDGEPLAAAWLRGDPHPAGPSLPLRRFADVTRSFGYAFARALDDLPAGAWRGPLPSPAGWHLVRVTARDPGGPARLAEVRAAVRRRVLDAQREALVRAAVERVVRRHTAAR
jgi:hypothetical protein